MNSATVLCGRTLREPSQEDFEHCAKRAMDFMASWSEDQTQMETALREFLETENYELSPQQTVAMNSTINAWAMRLSYIKNETTYGSPELIGKRSLGENVIVLYYNYRTDQGSLYCRFGFERTFDKNGEPLKWRCQPSVLDCDNDLSRVLLLMAK